MKKIFGLILLLGLSVFTTLPVNGQKVKMATPVFGEDIPIYSVTYEVIPSYYNCSESTQTIIFELPVTESYYDSVHEGQVLSSWFKAVDNQVYRASIPYQWKIKVILKRKWSR